MRNTKLSGGVFGLRERTELNNEDVIRYRQTELLLNAATVGSKEADLVKKSALGLLNFPNGSNYYPVTMIHTVALLSPSAKDLEDGC